ncbi:hypothetical protein CEUSTIGMA_g5111.t1 [Chlamydomonas eustigma]|uniref:Aminoglycoside phosphotransferase domain-containing protein n=1 Tax=Chlamydomonas eustigma TaxID=1157962 RepID=A0A250X3L8_9CHLO|nr:hypothetical protein CEUSTIGMA_g5111.t1 [Chlamydomonas eustigma]|eukprot:GAX77668.1 hypothetical protein CEUSTIGMA_g5111.t1 [Chlamydomonas eustigma]
MTLQNYDAAGAVRAAIDEESLKTFILENILVGSKNNKKIATLSNMDIKQFSHGQSDPTYLVTFSHKGNPPVRVVLRKKPAGKILPSAHAIEREYAVIKALHDHHTSVPVPCPLVLCEDPTVIGTPFYVMEFSEGLIFMDPNLPNMSPSGRSHIYSQMAITLSSLHAVIPDNVGLGSFGSTQEYCRRQVRRWTQQYHASVAGQPMNEALFLIDWLKAHIPDTDRAPLRPGICHGDYRLDNLVFHATSKKVTAVLDWELCTLGDCWADLAYNCLPYHLPPVPGLPSLLKPGEILPEGVPSEKEYVAMYCKHAGVSPPSDQDWAFYLALSLFRLLSILAGVQARSKQGNASSASAASVASNSVLKSLAEAAQGIVARLGSLVSSPKNSTLVHGVGSDSATSGGFDVKGLSPRVQSLRNALLSFMEQHVYPAETALEELASGPQRWTVSPIMEELKCKVREAPRLTVSPIMEELKCKVREAPRLTVSPIMEELKCKVREAPRLTVSPIMEELKCKAKACGLWNLWLPASLAAGLTPLLAKYPEDERHMLLGPGLNNLEYSHLCEITGRSPWAPEVFNCGAPDTGNMEVLAKYGNLKQQELWLLPLLRGEIRSCFAMTEKAVASSDATNIQASIVREGDAYLLNGFKWWTSGACDPRCQISIFMGKATQTGPSHKQQSMLLVPMSTPGVRVVRPLLVYGFDDAPHGHAEVEFKDVRVPVEDSLLLGEGRGFEIAQGRLGPGRLHHCMRLIGMAERAIELMARRALSRRAFGGPLAKQGALQSELAKARIDIDSARLLVLSAAAALDRYGFKGAKAQIAAAKVSAPNAALRVIDAAVQVHGGAGVCQDHILSRLWTHARTLRIADGPDEVHLVTLAKMELSKHSKDVGQTSKL